MAKACAMIHIVTAKAGAHKLLEQIGFFIAAFGGPEADEGFLPMLVANLPEFVSSQVQRLFPARLSKHVQHTLGIHREIAAFGGIRPPDQWLGQTLWVVGVVEAITCLLYTSPSPRD